MFTELNNLLDITSETNIDCEIIGICESEIESGFPVHHFLSYFLKKCQPVIFTSFCQSFNHYSTIGNKIGISLTKARDSKQLIFNDGVKYLGENVLGMSEHRGDNPWQTCMGEHGDINLQPIYIFVKSQVELMRKTNPSVQPVLVMDNVSTLLSLGVHLRDVVTFLHYCIGLVGVSVVSVCASVEDEESCLLWKFVQHMSTLTLVVTGLESGYCRDVHGELSVTWRKNNVEQKMLRKKRQFKLTDKSVQFFAAGMSSAVL